MSKTRDKLLDRTGNARPYIERAITDEDLRDNIRNAFRHYALMHGGRPEQLDDHARNILPSIEPVALGRRRRARLTKS